jgi:aminoglycoside phosphotransferase (APT) family kinase protein
MLGTPEAEVEIDAGLVKRLLGEQHPDLQHLSVKFIDAGWDNAMFRLGERLAVRLPRRAIAAPLLENEQRWLSHLARQLPVPIPTPYRIGVPCTFYPWHWSVIPWLPGRTVDEVQLNADQAQQIAKFLRALHITAVEDAPQNPFRGGPLVERSTVLTERMQRIEAKTDVLTPAVR